MNSNLSTAALYREPIRSTRNLAVAAARPEPVRLPAEELVNSLTHGLGLALAVVGALVMATVVVGQGDWWRIIGCTVYVASLIGVYAASTLSHSCSAPRRRSFFRALDQGFIYLLIVATYTPFSLVYLRSGPWWLLLAGMWAFALYCFSAKVFFAHRVESVAVWPCVLLGWIPIVAAPSLVSIVAPAALWWMLVGGICYTLGTIFLVFDTRSRHFHAIWHVMVIAGSACHFVAILWFVAQAA